MTHVNFGAIAAALLVTATFAMYAVAQAPSSSGSNQTSDQQAQNNQQNQSNNQQSQSDKQNQDNNQQNRQQDQQQDGSQDSRDASDKQERKDSERSNDAQNQANRDNERDSDRDAASQRDSSKQSDRQDRRDSDRARADDRRDSRDDRNADSRSRRSDDGRSRDASSRRGEMRGPDIGIWFNRSTRDGLVIADVSSKGVIAKLGFREGDRIVSVHGRRVTSETDFIKFLLHSDVDRVKVIVVRDGRDETIIVETRVLIEEYDHPDVDPLEQFGIIPDDRYDDRIVVWRVIPRSPAYYAGFRAGDVIVRFGDRSYRTRTEFERGAGDWKAGEINVQVRRGDRTRELAVDVPRFERQSDRTARRDERNERDSRDSIRSERGSVDRAEYRDDEQSQPVRRGGLLRGRGNR